MARQISFAVDKNLADMQTVVVNFSSPQLQQVSVRVFRSKSVLHAKLSVNTSEQICTHAEAFTLHQHNTIGKLTCRAAPLYHNAIKNFADKLYFFPRGNYCQVGRLLRAADNLYEVEFCGVQSAPINLMIASLHSGSTSNIKIEASGTAEFCFGTSSLSL